MKTDENKVDLNSFEFKLTDRVKELKIIARDSLRMNLLSTRLSTVSGLESHKTETSERIESLNKTIDVNQYETSKLDQEHPEYETEKEIKEESLKSMQEDIKHYEKDLKNLDEQIDEQRQAMAKIEKGDTKVSSSELSELVNKLILDHAASTARG